MVNKKAN